MTDKTYKIDYDMMRQVLDAVTTNDHLLRNRMFQEMLHVTRMTERQAYRDDIDNWQRWFDSVRDECFHLLTPFQQGDFERAEATVKNLEELTMQTRRLDSKLRGML